MSKYRVVAEGNGFSVERWDWYFPSWVEIAPHPLQPRFKTLEAAVACIERLKQPEQKRVVYQE